MQHGVDLKANDTLLFIGDSITDAERHRVAYRPLGYGYVHFAGNSLLARYPQLNLRILNMGNSGDTVLDLSRRWDADCLAYQPNVLSVLIGINDVWQRAMEPAMAETASAAREFELTYNQLLTRARDRCNCRLILMEPFMFCHDPKNEVLSALRPYVRAVRELADRHGATVVPLQGEIDRRVNEIPPERWSEDTVHPYLWAHAWIAQRWFEATGL